MQSVRPCHAKIDPAGFALESFDVMGGCADSIALWAMANLSMASAQWQKFAFCTGPARDATGQLPDGRKFHRRARAEKLLLADQRQIARNR